MIWSNEVTMKTKTLAGALLIVIGILLIIYYVLVIQPQSEAKKLLTEATLIYERNDKESINQAVTILTKIIARYPDTKTAIEAYYYIGQCYEKLNLNRLAYLKYVYLVKNNRKNLSDDMYKNILARIAHINWLQNYSEESAHQLLTLLNASMDRNYRSKIYSELGHLYLKNGEIQKAKRMFDIAINEDSTNEEAILGRARSLKHLGMDAEAYNHYDYFLRYYGAVSQYVNDVKNAYKVQAYKSGLNAFRSGHYSDAIGFFNRVLIHFGGDKLSENALYWIGESYFAMRQFDRAIAYFNKVLTNEFYHKDQDAQIKKGYAYFMQKKFDLAAREFQRYIREFPRGKYVAVAKEWKNMSTAELQNIIEGKKAESEGYIEEELKPKPQPQKNNTNENDLGLEEDEEVLGTVSQDFNDVNVAEF